MKTMNTLVTFVSLFRNTKDGKRSWGASFRVGSGENAVDVGATNLPKFDLGLFKPAVSKDGRTRYLASRFPLTVEFSDIRKGEKAGKFFTNISKIEAPERMDDGELDALLDGPVEHAEPAKDEPSVEDNADF